VETFFTISFCCSGEYCLEPNDGLLTGTTADAKADGDDLTTDPIDLPTGVFHFGAVTARGGVDVTPTDFGPGGGVFCIVDWSTFLKAVHRLLLTEDVSDPLDDDAVTISKVEESSTTNVGSSGAFKFAFHLGTTAASNGFDSIGTLGFRGRTAGDGAMDLRGVVAGLLLLLLLKGFIGELAFDFQISTTLRRFSDMGDSAKSSLGCGGWSSTPSLLLSLLCRGGVDMGVVVDLPGDPLNDDGADTADSGSLARLAIFSQACSTFVLRRLVILPVEDDVE
jgi:hypothetical protein